MSNKFDIIKNNYTNEILLIIFENTFKKENVKIKIINNDLIIQYEKGKIVFENEDKDTLFIIKNANNIFIVEIDLKNGKSKGKEKYSYKATL